MIQEKLSSLIEKIFVSMTKIESADTSMLEVSKFKSLHYSVMARILFFMLCSVFDGYYIPNKTVIFKKIKGVSWFSKMDCRSGQWQIKMDEQSIPLTTYSDLGYYKWKVMPFVLKIRYKYFKEEWIIFSKIFITVVQLTLMIFLSFLRPQHSTKIMT